MRRRRARPEGEGRPQAGQGGRGGRAAPPEGKGLEGTGLPEPAGWEHRGGSVRVRLQALGGRGEKPGKWDRWVWAEPARAGAAWRSQGCLQGVTRGQDSEMWG